TRRIGRDSWSACAGRSPRRSSGASRSSLCGCGSGRESLSGYSSRGAPPVAKTRHAEVLEPIGQIETWTEGLKDPKQKKSEGGIALCPPILSRLRFDPALFRGSGAGAAAARANLTLGRRR